MVSLFYRMIERDYAAMDARKENKEVQSHIEFGVYNTFEDVSLHRILVERYNLKIDYDIHLCLAGIVSRLSSMLTNMHCRFDPNQGRTTLCCLYVAVCGS